MSIMKAVMTIIRQDVYNLFTNPMWVFYNTLFGFLLVWILGVLCEGLYGDKITSYDYYGVAILVFAVLNGATISANSFMEERIKMGNIRILYSPVKSYWLYLSKIIGSFIFSVVCHLLLLGALVLCFGMQLGKGHYEILILLLLSGEIFASTLGVFMCCLLKSESSANQVLSLLIQLLSCLGGIFFSLDRFGEVFRMVSYLSPVKWLLQSFFLLIYDYKVIPAHYVSGGLVLCTVVLLWGCRKTFHEENCL